LRKGVPNIDRGGVCRKEGKKEGMCAALEGERKTRQGEVRNISNKKSIESKIKGICQDSAQGGGSISFENDRPRMPAQERGVQ